MTRQVIHAGVARSRKEIHLYLAGRACPVCGGPLSPRATDAAPDGLRVHMYSRKCDTELEYVFEPGPGWSEQPDDDEPSYGTTDAPSTLIPEAQFRTLLDRSVAWLRQVEPLPPDADPDDREAWESGIKHDAREALGALLELGKLARAAGRTVDADLAKLEPWLREQLAIVAPPSEARSVAIHGVALDASEQFIAVAQDDGVVSLWDVRSGLRKFELRGHTGAVRAVAFAGRRLASASVDGSIALWDIDTGKPRLDFARHAAAVLGVAFSPDGQRLASTCEDGSVSLWDAQSGALLAALVGHQESVLGVAWAPDGQFIVTASFDRTARVWSGQGTERARLASQLGPVFGVACAKDGRIAMACSRGAQIVAPDPGAAPTVVGTEYGSCHAVAFTDRGQLVVGAEHRILVLENGKQRMLVAHRGLVNAVACSAGGMLLVSGADDGTVRVWDLVSAPVGFDTDTGIEVQRAARVLALGGLDDEAGEPPA